MLTPERVRPGRDLIGLARLHGVQIAYRDAFGARKTATVDTLLAVLGALGVPVADPSRAGEALREAGHKRDSLLAPPTAVCWEGSGELNLRLGGPAVSQRIECHLEMEDGSEKTWSADSSSLPVLLDAESQTQAVFHKLVLPGGLPAGYHRLHLKAGKRIADTLVVSAPTKAFQRAERRWGVFAPLYALHSKNSWGVGDFTDLGVFLDWIGRLGGSFAGTLPLLACFLDQPFEPSPYSPASRLFWNEVFIDVAAAGDLDHFERARELISSHDFKNRVADLRARPLVDYRGVMAVKRQVLEHLSRDFFRGGADRLPAFQKFLSENPWVQDYARFRAEADLQKSPWPQWQGSLTDSGETVQANRNYHLYVQWLCHQQLTEAGRHGKPGASGMYMDLSLGANRASFDTWRWPELFALSASTGAPPDPAFTTGQDWGLPPLHPQRIQSDGYTYQIACLRHLMVHSQILRIDHIMGMHRLFWVPEGMSPSEGTYVKYPAEDLYATLTLESHRNQTEIIGEDLGTVPGYVRNKMHKHGILGSHILEYEMLDSGKSGAVRPPPPDSLAALNTHDMYPFAGFWETVEQPYKGSLAWAGVSPDLGAEAAIKRAVEHLASSRARLTLINIEDLWMETAPQNIPGTSGEDQPNWRRRLRYSLEEIDESPEINRALSQVNGSVNGSNSAASQSRGNGG